MADSSGWQRHAEEQRRAWLRLSFAERLRWLEQAKRFQQVALGAARKAARSQEGPNRRSPNP
jgi:hypothetical protein